MENAEWNRDELLKQSTDLILEYLEQKKYFMARDELMKYNAADIAEMLEEVSDEASLRMTVILFRLLPKDVSVDVFSYMSSDGQVDIVSEITDKETQFIVDELDFDDKIDILEELPANLVNRILEKTPRSERHLINTFLNYPDNSAGSLMTPEFVSLKKDWTVREAMEHIKEVGTDAETIYTCYVRDNAWKLIGIVPLSTLVVTNSDTKINEVMRTEFVCEYVDTDQEEVSDDFQKYDLIAIPVVDKEYRLVGIITVDDILDVMEDEATEDIERMNGVIDLDNSDSDYLDISVIQHAKNRLPWLLVLMIAYIFTGMIVTNFENALSSMIALVTYMPMLMGTGGNCGSQAATLIIRGLATGEVELDDWMRIMWKELRIGVVVGVVLSAVNFLRVTIIDGQSAIVAVTVCTSLLFIVMIAKLIGSMIPLIVKGIHLDPALVANPAISSVSDAIALSIYFVMAGLFLHV
ncbi:magnesium transporter [Eubacterium pyruvativorans]|uniref:Magnesium transporter MgtE n=2 Tax=Eubacterium TaxID=1730 RepID=A0A1I7GDJ9_9FIRM|nr:magnesium transporter [Eubacterium pyruvativorans]MCI5747336.1 magnesium transporter [Eubacterium pyruvativorans]MDD7685374.1 magnesium transporter [Eubacterium pyruvativorans]MDY4049103.1 magnesium transporter [Eubacterium pyruvativorans]SDF01317.1 magnesium transporter [Eubacterium pyruvativorans]SFO09426.1 magnesium transporter [Eubacterium pyruvativorans]